jgi:6-pyruvoyltetrahydropterin/6-carboxytetrahydropterin synthase
MKTALIRRAQFNAAHRLHNPAWSDEKNHDFYGKCNLPNYHGHNYVLYVKVSGNVDPESGYVMDAGVLARIIKEEVEEPFDHRNLNLDTEEFRNTIPTAENIAQVIYSKIKPRLDADLDLKITLYETERNCVEYPA